MWPISNTQKEDHALFDDVGLVSGVEKLGSNLSGLFGIVASAG